MRVDSDNDVTTETASFRLRTTKVTILTQLNLQLELADTSLPVNYIAYRRSREITARLRGSRKSYIIGAVPRTIWNMEGVFPYFLMMLRIRLTTLKATGYYGAIMNIPLMHQFHNIMQ